MMGWWWDARIALRGLRRRPGFALGVALTLGLGVGATTSIFSVVDAVVLRPLAFEDPDRLVAIGTTFPTREWADREVGLQHLAGINLLNVRDYTERARSVTAVGSVESISVMFPDAGSGPELVPAARVSERFFEILGVTPSLGRTFLPDEFTVSNDAVALLSWGTWQRRYGGDPDILGRSLGSVGSAVTVVGVLPRSFRSPEAFLGREPELWIPLSVDHERYASRGMRSLHVVGRLATGTSLESGRSEARAIAAELAAEFPEGNVYPDGTYFGIGMNSLHAETVGTAGRTLNIWIGAAALLLLLSVMNAGSLLLVRSMDRSRELAVRLALGSGRGSLVRLLLIEATLLSLAGAALGLGLAYAGVDLFVRFAPPEIPRVEGVAVDGRVLAVAVSLALTAGLLSGLLPASRHTGRAPWLRLGGGGRTVASSGSRIRSVLVAGQLAIAMTLLSGAGLLANSFVRIMTVEPGFEPDDLVTMNIPLKRPGAPAGEEAWQAWDAALSTLRSVPGVASVAGTTNPPFQAPFWAPRIVLPGDPPDLWREGIAGYAITPGYLETVGTRVRSGRGFLASDGPDSERVVLVNEAFVATVLEEADAVGAVIHSSEAGDSEALRIVGIVEDVVQSSADEGRRPAVYFPYAQTDWPMMQAVVRSTRGPDVLVPELRQALTGFSPMVVPQDVQTMRSRMARSRVGPRFQAFLVGAFALVALLLAATGLYGSLSHAVGRRQRELGVRMALGAARAGVLRMVLRQGLALAAAGVTVGLGAAWWGTRLLTGFLYEVEPNDPGTLTAVALVLMGVAAVACWNPARRATTVDPVEVLRSD